MSWRFHVGQVDHRYADRAPATHPCRTGTHPRTGRRQQALGAGGVGISAPTARDMTAIPEECQRVAGGRAKRYLRFRQGQELHPGGVPEQRSARVVWHPSGMGGATTHAPGISSRVALLNPRLPSGIPPGWLSEHFPPFSHSTEKSEEPCPRLQLGRSAAFRPLHRPEAAGQWFGPCRSDVEAA